FFFSSRRRHTRFSRDWSSDVCSSDLAAMSLAFIWGQAGLLCFGQSVFFGTGAYIAGLGAKGMLPGLPELGWSVLPLAFLGSAIRSEERRVGKECRARWWADQKRETQK